MRIRIASKNLTTILLHGFNNLGYRTFWQRYGANFIYIYISMFYIRSAVGNWKQDRKNHAHTLSVCLSTYVSVYLSISISVYLSIYLPVCVSIYLHLRISICLFVYVCIHPSTCLSVYRYVCLPNLLECWRKIDCSRSMNMFLHFSMLCCCIWTESFRRGDLPCMKATKFPNEVFVSEVNFELEQARSPNSGLSKAKGKAVLLLKMYFLC
jgi:hypothetical protein